MNYMVLHYSLNWCMDGLAIRHFGTLEEAQRYVREFTGGSAHRNDKARIVRLISEHDIKVLDKTDTYEIHGFFKNEDKGFLTEGKD